MGCRSSKEVIPCVGPGGTSGKISKASKKIVQEMWLELKPDLKNFGVSIFIRYVSLSKTIFYFYIYCL